MKTALLACLALAACKNDKPQLTGRPVSTDMVTGSDGSGGVAQMHIGGGDSTDGDIPFVITKSEKQEGGTYIEAHLASDAAATFAFIAPEMKVGDEGFGFGKVTLVPTTTEAGAKVVARLAAGLATVAPAPTKGGILQKKQISVAVLGHQVAMLDNGMGGAGTWEATKLFCSVGEIDSAELFFDWSVTEKRGFFGQKDTDYNKDAVACLATILRDGLPPPRSVANDPTMTDQGPHFDLGPVVGARVSVVAFTPTHLLITDERGDQAALADVDLKTGALTDRYTTKDRIDSAYCDAALSTCIVSLSTPSEGRKSYTGDDKASNVLLEGSKATPFQIAEGSDAAVGYASPDLRFVVGSRREPAGLQALDRTAKKTFSFPTATDESLSIAGWNGTTATVMRYPFEETRKPTFVAWKLGANGATAPMTEPRPVPVVSPDKTRSAVFTERSVVVTVAGKSRELVFNPADKGIDGQSSLWIDNRWIGTKAGFIDTDAMKIAPFARDDDDRRDLITFVAGSRVAFVDRGGESHLATIVGP
ncbi:MAG TPA: hypothetical protein VGM90_22470 [Kofleriaceae bacterium]|jgi:hypothetical protein